MDDSNILYYLALGAIYIISRFLKKKKPPVETPDFDASEPQQTPHKTVSSPSSVDEILKELTKQFEPQEEPEQIQVVEKKPDYRPNYREENIEAIGPDEQIDIVPHKQIERERPKYERSNAFIINEDEGSGLREGVLEILDDEDGLKKAIILKEILDRKY